MTYGSIPWMSGSLWYFKARPHHCIVTYIADPQIQIHEIFSAIANNLDYIKLFVTLDTKREGGIY